MHRLSFGDLDNYARPLMLPRTGTEGGGEEEADDEDATPAVREQRRQLWCRQPRPRAALRLQPGLHDAEAVPSRSTVGDLLAFQAASDIIGRQGSGGLGTGVSLSGSRCPSAYACWGHCTGDNNAPQQKSLRDENCGLNRAK